MILVAHIGGAIFGAWIVLLLLMFCYRKLRRRPNNRADIVVLGLATLAICTIIRGYGEQDYAPEPDFLASFLISYGPAMTATVVELLRLKTPQISN